MVRLNASVLSYKIDSPFFARSIIPSTSSVVSAFMARHFRDRFSAIHIAPLAFCLTRRTAKIVFLQGEPPTHFFHRSRCSRGDKTIERTLRKSRRVLNVTIKRNALPIIFLKKYVLNLLTRKTPKNQAQFIATKVFEKICARSLDSIYRKFFGKNKRADLNRNGAL